MKTLHFSAHVNGSLSRHASVKPRGTVVSGLSVATASKRITASKSAAQSGIELRREEQIGREYFCRVVPRRVVEVFTSKAHVRREAGTEAASACRAISWRRSRELDASAAHGP